MSESFKRLIKGEPYLFKRNEDGSWGVSACGRRTDRFHRNYAVYCRVDGFPRKCTCNHFVKQGAWCKHLQEVERIFKEQHPEYEESLRQEAINSGFLEGNLS